MKTYQFMWTMIRYRPWLYTLNGIVWILIHYGPIIPGLIISKLLDTLANELTLNSHVWMLTALLLATALARIVLLICGGLTDVHHRFSMSSLLRRNMLEQLITSNSEKNSVGDTIIKFREDADQIETSISWTLDVTGKVIFSMFSFILLFTISSKITLLIFLPLIFIITVSNLSNRKLKKYRHASRNSSTELASFVGEIAELTPVIQSFQAEQRVVDRFTKLNDERKGFMIKDKMFSSFLNLLASNTVSIGTGLILIVSAGDIQNGTISIGDFSLFVYYLAFITESTQFFGVFLASYRQAGISFSRMAQFFSPQTESALVKHQSLKTENVSEVKVDKHDPLLLLEIHSLSYQFKESEKGIFDVSFRLPKGSITVIAGKVGSGKTTLLRTILGHLPMQSGEIKWNGDIIKTPHSFFVPPKSSYTPQTPILFSDTIKENIILGMHGDNVIDRAIYTAVLEEDVPEFNNGLDTQIGPNGVKLSGGQIQRTALARMFARDADLYVMDDISSAVDVVTEQKMWARIKELSNKTFLISSNRRECLQYADQIIVLKDGKIVDIGSLTDLLSRCKEFQELWNV